MVAWFVPAVSVPYSWLVGALRVAMQVMGASTATVPAVGGEDNRRLCSDAASADLVIEPCQASSSQPVSTCVKFSFSGGRVLPTSSPSALMSGW